MSGGKGGHGQGNNGEHGATSRLKLWGQPQGTLIVDVDGRRKMLRDQIAILFAGKQ